MCVSTNSNRGLTLHTSYAGTAVNPTSEVSGYETLGRETGKNKNKIAQLQGTLYWGLQALFTLNLKIRFCLAVGDLACNGCTVLCIKLT